MTSLVMDTVSAIYTESYRQRLDLNFKAAVQTVNAHLNQNHIFPEFSFLAFSCLVFSRPTCIFDGAEISFLAFSVAPLKAAFISKR